MHAQIPLQTTQAALNGNAQSRACRVEMGAVEAGSLETSSGSRTASRLAQAPQRAPGSAASGALCTHTTCCALLELGPRPAGPPRPGETRECPGATQPEGRPAGSAPSSAAPRGSCAPGLRHTCPGAGQASPSAASTRAWAPPALSVSGAFQLSPVRWAQPRHRQVKRLGSSKGRTSVTRFRGLPHLHPGSLPEAACGRWAVRTNSQWPLGNLAPRGLSRPGDWRLVPWRGRLWVKWSNGPSMDLPPACDGGLSARGQPAAPPSDPGSSSPALTELRAGLTEPLAALLDPGRL